MADAARIMSRSLHRTASPAPATAPPAGAILACGGWPPARPRQYDVFNPALVVRESADRLRRAARISPKNVGTEPYENSCRALPCFEHKTRLSTAQSNLLKN